MTTTEEWAHVLADENAFVMHLPTLTVGRVKQVFGPSGERYVSTLTNEPTPDPVIVLEDGNAFIANPQAFMRLGEAEARFFVAAHEAVGRCAIAILQVAKKIGVVEGVAKRLLGVALRTVASIHERSHREP